MTRSPDVRAQRQWGTAVTLLLLTMHLGQPPVAVAACRASPKPEAQGGHSFLGYACREPECAAHKAGFGWADRRGISDPAACADTNDVAFGEGCRAFAELAITAEQSGFEWARANALPDDCFCDGAGPRFAAGCEAFVRAFGG